MKTQNQNKTKLQKMTEKELKELKHKRYLKYSNLQNKAQAYLKLVSEVNDEQVERFLSSIRRKKNE